MFPLCLKDGLEPLKVDMELLKNKAKEQEKRTSKLSDEEVLNRALDASQRLKRNGRQGKSSGIRAVYD
jgi:proteasome assembly chaperone (PAC2) family protein